MFDVQITGLDGLKLRLSQIAGSVDAAVDQALGEGAEMIAARAAERAPRRTGELAGSITYERESMGHWLAGTDLWRAQFSEFGTVHADAKPFLFPSFEELRDRIAYEVAAAKIQGAILGVIG
jgi:HK97 gp10 family phage protein